MDFSMGDLLSKKSHFALDTDFRRQYRGRYEGTSREKVGRLSREDPRPRADPVVSPLLSAPRDEALSRHRSGDSRLKGEHRPVEDLTPRPRWREPRKEK